MTKTEKRKRADFERRRPLLDYMKPASKRCAAKERRTFGYLLSPEDRRAWCEGGNFGRWKSEEVPRAKTRGGRRAARGKRSGWGKRQGKWTVKRDRGRDGSVNLVATSSKSGGAFILPDTAAGRKKLAYWTDGQAKPPRMRRNPYAANLTQHLHVSKASDMEPVPYWQMTASEMNSKADCPPGFKRAYDTGACVPKKASRRLRDEISLEDAAERRSGLTPNRRRWTKSERASVRRMSRKQNSERKLACGHHWSGDECDTPCFRGDTLPHFPKSGKNLKARQRAWLDAEDPEAATLGRRGASKYDKLLCGHSPTGSQCTSSCHRFDRGRAHFRKKGRASRSRAYSPPRKHKPWKYTRKGKRAMRRRMRRNCDDMRPNRHTDTGTMTSAAHMIARRDGVSIASAMKRARSTARKMPGHPTAKAIAAEGRITGKSRTRTGKMPVGTGQRFRAMVSALMRDGKSEKQARAIAAAHGRKKYGAKYFNELGRLGKKRAQARRRGRR